MAIAREQTSTDIQAIPQSEKGGKDYIIGDLHGNRKCLEAVLAKLQPNDRLFIVGDLTDRGDDSPGVIRLIEENNRNADRPRIHCIRGNHESLCLNTIEGLEKYVPEVGALPPMDKFTRLTHHDNEIRLALTKAQHHMKRNGGEWLVQLFREELRAKPPLITLDTGVVVYQEGSQVKKIKEFMSQLPYIMQVTGIASFNTVHADMPYSDDTLKSMLEKKATMTDATKAYSTWARQGKQGKVNDTDYTNTGRTEYSIPTLVGHNIVKNGVPVVRYNTNTIDADVGAYDENAILLINHTDGKSEIVNVDGYTASPTLIAVRDEANVHLGEQFALRGFLEEVNQISDVQAFLDIVDKYTKIELKQRDTEHRGKFYNKAQLCLIAKNHHVLSAEISRHIQADTTLSQSIQQLNFMGGIKNCHSLNQIADFLDLYQDTTTPSISDLLSESDMAKTLSKIFAAGLHPNMLSHALITDLLTNDFGNVMLTSLIEAGFNLNQIPSQLLVDMIMDTKQTTTFEKLLNAGLDPNKTLESGASLIHIATANGMHQNIKLLIEKGANPSSKDADNNNTTPLAISMMLSDDSAKSILIEGFIANNKKHPLYVAAQHDDDLLVRALLDLQIDGINKANPKSGHTPLLIAVAHNNLDMAKNLINHGADINLPLNNGLTPLHIALAEGNKEMATLLIQHGADKKASFHADKQQFMGIFETACQETKDAAAEYCRRQPKKMIEVTPEVVAIIASQGQKNSRLIQQITSDVTSHQPQPLPDEDKRANLKP